MCRTYTGQERAMKSGLMDMILAIIGISTAVADVVPLTNPDVDMTPDEITASNSTVVLLYVMIGISVIRFLMGLVLRKGARRRDRRMVSAWLIVSVILWLLQIVQFITKLVIGAFVIWSTISTSVAILIRMVVMVLVFNFIKEIGQERSPLLGVRYEYSSPVPSTSYNTLAKV